MAKDPAILFYTSDFLTGTFTMTDEQVGRYIKLLCLQHQKGSLTLKDMRVVCKGDDVEVFAKFDKDDKGNFFNKTLREHSEKRKSYSESRRNNRKHKEHMNNISKTYVQHMENENVIENVNRDLKERKAEFFELSTKTLESENPNTVNDFNEYWTEHSPNGKKMRFELQKVFDIKRRFATWKRNNFGAKKADPVNETINAYKKAEQALGIND